MILLFRRISHPGKANSHSQPCRNSNNTCCPFVLSYKKDTRRFYLEDYVATPMEVSPSKDLFCPQRTTVTDDAGADKDNNDSCPLDNRELSPGSEMEVDEDEPLEEIYHLPLRHFYPSRNVSLLQRSMGISVDCPQDLVRTPSKQPQTFLLNFARQDQVRQAGSLRNYIIIGSRPTYPFTLITFLRQIRYNPFDPWEWAVPEAPFTSKPASIVHWYVDTEARLLKPCPPSSVPPSIPPSRSGQDLDLMRVHTAWDIKRDELAQTVIWSSSTGLANRVFELRYGEQVGCLEMLKDLEAFVCFCGCSMEKQDDVHLKIFLKSGMLFWFPYEKRQMLKGTKHFRYIQNEQKGATPFLYLDLSARTKEEMEKYIKDANVDIRAIDLCVLNRPQPVRFSRASEHANWYASVEVLFLFVEWSSRNIFHITYRVNPLEMTARVIRIARLKDEDKKRLAVTHTHECDKISADLGVKHYPKWSYTEQSLSNIKLEELNLELKLDFLPPWFHDPGSIMEFLGGYDSNDDDDDDGSDAADDSDDDRTSVHNSTERSW